MQALLGTNSEASHCNSSERVLIISCAGQTLDAAGLEDVPLLVGTGGNSARETIQSISQRERCGDVEKKHLELDGKRTTKGNPEGI